MSVDTVGDQAPIQGPLSVLVGWASSGHAFRRNRVSKVLKVIAAALCNSGYSYRDVARMIGGMSYIAVRDAYISVVTCLPEVKRTHRRAVAIDGGDVALGERQFHLWVARDVESGNVLTFQASPGASVEDGARFLSVVASQCENKPLLRLGHGPNQPKGLVNLDLYFTTETSDSLIAKLGRLLAWTRPETRAV